jgi:hypothetical protein
MSMGEVCVFLGVAGGEREARADLGDAGWLLNLLVLVLVFAGGFWVRVGLLWGTRSATPVAEFRPDEPPARVGEPPSSRDSPRGCSLASTALAADETLLNLNVSACSRSLSPRSFHYHWHSVS